MRRPVHRVLVAVAAIALSGCATLDSISGSATMRIDVEVYKGPLAKDPWTQWGELLGIVRETRSALASNILAIDGAAMDDRCYDHAGKKITKDTPPAQPLFPDSCGLYIGLHTDVAALTAVTQQRESDLLKLSAELQNIPIHDADRARLKVGQVLSDLMQMTIVMQTKAFYWSGTHVGAIPQSRNFRRTMTNFAVLASELSNQIATRADALLQQMAGPDRRELPLSLHLRNTNATDFWNLYVWNRAGNLALFEDMILRPNTAFSSEETADRVRAYERLFGDYNWSNVNSVYASGQGDVSMAFIKDDIGNWNLKTFDNDPTELLKGYVEVGKAALKAAAEAVAASSGAGAVGPAIEQVTKATQFVQLANRVAYGRSAAPQATVAGIDVATLHTRTAVALDGLKSQAANERTGLTINTASNQASIDSLRSQMMAARQRAIDERKKKANAANADETAAIEANAVKIDLEAAGYEKRIEALEQKNRENDERLANQPNEVAKAARTILDRYRTLIDTLQEGVLTTPAGAGNAPALITPSPAAVPGAATNTTTPLRQLFNR